MYVIFQGAKEEAQRAFDREYPSLTNHELFKNAFILLKEENGEFVVGLSNRMVKRNKFLINFRPI